MKGRTRILLLALLTLIVFPLVGFILYFFVEEDYRNFTSIFKSKSSLLLEFGVGILSGTILGLLAWLMINSKLMHPVLEKYGGLIQSLQLNIPAIIIVSLCAGIGEEIFFRGVLQTYLGVIITAIVFVAIHGYLTPYDWRISIYGLYMTAAIVVLGYMHVCLGLTSAMVAHTFIDIVLFYLLTKKKIFKDKIIIPG